MATLGWTWEYIDTCMTIPRLLALTEHWNESPPRHEAFAAFMGAFSGTQKPPRLGAVNASRIADGEDGGDGDFTQFMQAFGALGGVVAVN